MKPSVPLPRVLCVDVGNSSAHLACLEGTAPVEQAELPTHEVAAHLAAVAVRWGVTGVAWCSVVPAVSEALRRALEGLSVPVLELDHRCCPGLPVTYPDPAEIGPDRLANAIGAQVVGRLPALVIDLGTATTVSVVRRTEGYVGGMIGPGLRLMTDYLHEKTARLPRLQASDVVAFCPTPGEPGRSTEAAMLLGCQHGYRGLVTALLREAATMVPVEEGTPAVIVTGGAVAILRVLPEAEAWHFHPRLTFIGLATAWQRAFGLPIM